MADSTSRMDRDSTGKPLRGFDFDFEMPAVAIYVDDGAGGVTLWDGDVTVSGDLYIALDDVETLLTAIRDRIGEIQASPTQYSLLERLKVLDTELKLKANLTETQPVSAASLPLPAGASTEATLAFIKTAVEIIDDWDESDRAKINLIVGQAGIAAGAGAVGVTVPRVTLASDDPLLVEQQDTLQDYFFSGYNVSGTAVYIGYEDKAGAYYIMYVETSTGVVTFAKGTGGIPTPTNYSGESFASFATTF